MIGKLAIYAGVVSAAALAYFGWKLTARAAYESAEYTVVHSESRFEIREYPDLILATTNTRLKLRGKDGSFMRLFRYISGANDREQKIAMTTPVFMNAESNDTDGQMGFVVPRKVAEQRVPEPSNEDVRIRKRADGRFAVIRLAGRANGDSLAEAETSLRSWMKEKGLIGNGGAEFAGYDPPWTPGPLPRNEILIRLK